MANFNIDRVSNQAATQHFYASVSINLAEDPGRPKLTYSYVAHRPVVSYVPRPHLHRQIEKQLHDGRQDASDTRILVVQGLGGSGKSQLVLNYMREHQGDYSTIFWIEAGQKESVERDYLQIHRLLFSLKSVTEPDAVSVEDAVVAVKRWFHGQTERSLVVFDNADAIDDNSNDESYLNLELFLPYVPTVDVIITTRYAGAAELTTLAAIEVGEMETSEAAELFQRCAKLGGSPELDVNTEVLQIVRELGKLALAIALAGSYVAAKPRLRSDIRLYLPEYRKLRKRLLGIKGNKLIHRYGESVLSTWETSFAAVKWQSAMAARLLSLLAFLSFDDIFLELFRANEASNRRWQAYLSPYNLPDLHAIEEAFEVLRAYSLIQWREEQSGYTMHKLVHAWGQDRLELEQQQYLSLMALELLIDIITSTAGSPIFGIRLVPHIMANFAIISSITAASATIHSEILDFIAVVGKFLHSLGRWSDEYEVRVFHFSKICKSAGTEHPSTLRSMNSLALVLSCQGKYEQAEEMHRQALRLRETVLGKEHPDTLMSMDNLASVLDRQGKYEQAEEMHRQVLRLREIVLGKEHPSTLTSMNNLASVLRGQGRYNQAEEMHRQALRLTETVLDKEHPDTLTSMNNLALVLICQGKFEQAEEMHRQALRLRETVLGKEHPDTLASMNNLASVLRGQGRYDQAEEMHRQALRLMETALGKEHPDTLTSMTSLALVLSGQGKYEQAEELHRQALRFRETVLGKEHPDTLTSMTSLALVLSAQGRYEQAEELHRQAIRFRETVLGKDHPDTLASMKTLADVLEWMQQVQQERISSRTISAGSTVNTGEVSGPVHGNSIENESHSRGMAFSDSGYGGSMKTEGHSRGTAFSDSDYGGSMKTEGHTRETALSTSSFTDAKESDGLQYNSDDDLRSIVSDKDEISSQASTTRTQQEVVAEEHLAILLARNKELNPLYKEALMKMKKSRFVRNFRRLLKRYYLDLLQTANSNLERATVHLLRSKWSRIRIAQRIVDQISPANEQVREQTVLRVYETESQLPELMKWIEGNPGFTPPIEIPEPAVKDGDLHHQDDSSGDEGSEEEDHTIILPNIPEMEEFLIGGSAFQALTISLRTFLLPEPLKSTSPTLSVTRLSSLRHKWSSLCEIDFWNRHDLVQSCVSTFLDTRQILALFQSSPLPIGLTRLEWTCQCGHKSFDDYSLKPAAVRKLAEKMIRSGSIISASTTDQATSKLVDFWNSIRNMGITLWRSVSSKENQPITRSPAEISHTLSQAGPEISPNFPLFKFVALCLHTTTFVPSLTHLQVYPSSDDGYLVNSDQELFRRLRKVYTEQRSGRVGMKICGIYFVKFSVRPKGFTDNLKENELPPKENGDYEYKIEDGNDDNQVPIGSNWMMHLYDVPADSGDSTICLDAFPKKKKERLTWKRTGKNVGWGVYFKEEPRKLLFAGAKFVVALASGLVFGLCWKDRSFPWAVVAWITVVVALAFDWFEAWLVGSSSTTVGKEKVT